MNSDSHYMKGINQDVCAGYADHDYIGDLQIACVADGGSGSSITKGRINIGSRLLCRTFINTVKHKKRMGFDLFQDESPLHRQVFDGMITRMSALQDSLDLPKYSWDASLIGMVADANRLWVQFWGDGTFIVKEPNDDKIYMKCFAFVPEDATESPSPYYLGYFLDTKRHARYLDSQKNNVVLEQMFVLDKDKIVHSSTATHLIDPSLPDIMSYSFDMDIDYVLACSNGMTSFVYEDEKMVPIVDIGQAIGWVKNKKGPFVKRALKRLHEWTWRDHLMHHLEDFSVAGISVHTP